MTELKRSTKYWHSSDYFVINLAMVAKVLSLTPNSYDRKHIEEHLQVKRLLLVVSCYLCHLELSKGNGKYCLLHITLQPRQIILLLVIRYEHY